MSAAGARTFPTTWRIGGSNEPRGLGLAPLAVVPEQQRRRIGTQLVKAALRRARLLGYAYVVVLGDPRYYGRFGFAPASRLGLRYEETVPDEAFMALEVRDGSLKGASGVVCYLPAFSGGAKSVFALVASVGGIGLSAGRA